METFKVPVEVGGPSGRTFESLEVLVDTGATYAVIPGSVRRGLSVVPHRTSTFELADGSRQKWEMGRTCIRIDGKVEMALVVFGAEGAGALPGAVTLDESLLAPDPIKRRRAPVAGLLV